MEIDCSKWSARTYFEETNKVSCEWPCRVEVTLGNSEIEKASMWSPVKNVKNSFTAVKNVNTELLGEAANDIGCA